MRFTKFLSELSDTQYEFRQRCATQDAIIKFTERVYALISVRNFSSAFFIDYSKAFDTMNHGMLFRRLVRYGIREVATELKADCFYSRYQFVKLYDELSTALQITIRVSQGSVPGSLQFSLYVNDLLIIIIFLFRVLPSFLTIMYAYDTTLLSIDTNFINQVNVGNTELTVFYDWALVNRISTNAYKTFCIIYEIRSVDIEVPELFLGNVQIEALEVVYFFVQLWKMTRNLTIASRLSVIRYPSLLKMATAK